MVSRNPEIFFLLCVAIPWRNLEFLRERFGGVRDDWFLCGEGGGGTNWDGMELGLDGSVYWREAGDPPPTI